MSQSTAKELPPLDLINKLLHYDKDAGLLSWKEKRCGVTAGKLAGSVCNKGYTRIKINGSLFLSHRLIWKIETGEDPVGLIVDHADNNPSNNKIGNLRVANHGQNQANGKVYSNNKTGFRGVSWHKQHRKYVAAIQHNGKRRHIGLFMESEDAAQAYDAAARSLFGEFACTNF